MVETSLEVSSLSCCRESNLARLLMSTPHFCDIARSVDFPRLAEERVPDRAHRAARPVPMSGGGPGGLQASRVLRMGCHELRQEGIRIGPALKSAVHIRLLAHEDDLVGLLVSHCAGQQHEQP